MHEVICQTLLNSFVVARMQVQSTRIRVTMNFHENYYAIGIRNDLSKNRNE